MVNQAAAWECVRLAAAFLTSTLLVQYHGIRSENGCTQLFSALPPRPLRLSALSLFRHFFLPPRTAYHWHPPTGPSITPSASPSFVTSLLSLLLSSLPPAALPAPPATLFHPWLANASVNISSPIFTGAKRSRAPSAFHRTPPCRSRATISIAGLKSAPATAR